MSHTVFSVHALDEVGLLGLPHCGGTYQGADGSWAFVIRVPGEIRGKGRPRFARRGKFVTVHSDEKTVSAEGRVQAAAMAAVGQPCLLGPLKLTVRITVTIPASWSQKKQREAMGGYLWPTGRPDADNALKLLCDALNGIVWKDDAQLVDVRVEKRYGRVPGAVLWVGRV